MSIRMRTLRPKELCRVLPLPSCVLLYEMGFGLFSSEAKRGFEADGFEQ